MTHPAIIPAAAVLVGGICAVIAGWTGGLWAALPALVAGAIGGWLAIPVRSLPSPAERRRRLIEECELLERERHLQRRVFEVAAELVGCTEENDARERFTTALRSWWAAPSGDLFVWERGAWRSLGGKPAGPPPVLTGPVQLAAADQDMPDLILDLSPAVDGQAAMVLREPAAQPTLAGRDPSDQRYVAEVLRGQLALSLRRVTLYQDLRRLARSDRLTDCFRRWYVEQRLTEDVERGCVVSVIMVDIDAFKQVNDQHGHAAGDEVLKAVAQTLRDVVRPVDLVGRWGGEEFLVLLHETPQGPAVQAAERLREAVAALADLPCPVTVSLGVAGCLIDDTADDLIKRADDALYRAKDGGRNRVEHAVMDDEANRLRMATRRFSSARRRAVGS